jgi:tetratricopeptide (TPR) repeat protein
LRWGGDLDAAVACFADAEARRRSQRDLRAIAIALIGRAYAEAGRGNEDAAREHVREAIAMMRRTGDEPGVALTLNVAALIAEQLGRPETALPRAEECLRMADDVSPLWAIGWQYLQVARLRHVTGDGAGSARAVDEATAAFVALGDVRGELAVQSARKEGVVTLSS